MTAEYTPQNPQYPDVTVELVGQDGNAFGVIGRVRKAIQRAHGGEAAKAFSDAAFECDSYDALLMFVMRTVDIS